MPKCPPVPLSCLPHLILDRWETGYQLEPQSLKCSIPHRMHCKLSGPKQKEQEKPASLLPYRKRAVSSCSPFLYFNHGKDEILSENWQHRMVPLSATRSDKLSWRMFTSTQLHLNRLNPTKCQRCSSLSRWKSCLAPAAPKAAGCALGAPLGQEGSVSGCGWPGSSL